jgi:hypothetical protein
LVFVAIRSFRITHAGIASYPRPQVRAEVELPQIREESRSITIYEERKGEYLGQNEK